MDKNSRLYERYYTSNGFERADLFEMLVDQFASKQALYPGSFVHITPSFAIPSVTYVDSDRRCPGFFADPAMRKMVQDRKRYDGEPDITFHSADYGATLPLEDETHDLLVSQWAGPVSQACKRYLAAGGLLLVNDSHGDASLASLDADYELVATVSRAAGRHSWGRMDLSAFFVPKSGTPVIPTTIRGTGKGVAYTRSAAAYVFRRVH